MNELDRKILETLGWSEGLIKLRPQITTDMLIEAACKLGEWTLVWEKLESGAYQCAFVFADDEHEWHSGVNIRHAIRAALAAYWGIDDASSQP